MKLKEETEAKMVAAIEHLKADLHGIRTGRANPAMVTGIKIVLYGSEMRLQDVASVTAPESRQLLITPYDRNTTSAIEKGLREANLGFLPQVDGHLIRIKIPVMDDAMRKEMVKLCHQYREKAKVVIRNERQNSNKLARKQKNDGDIGEDVMNSLEKAVQTLTDKYCKVVDELCATKEKEVSTL